MEKHPGGSPVQQCSSSVPHFCSDLNTRPNYGGRLPHTCPFPWYWTWPPSWRPGMECFVQLHLASAGYGFVSSAMCTSSLTRQLQTLDRATTAKTKLLSWSSPRTHFSLMSSFSSDVLFQLWVCPSSPSSAPRLEKSRWSPCRKAVF